MVDYAKLRHGGKQVHAAVTLVGAVITAFIVWCNAMETSEKQYDAERIAKGETKGSPIPYNEQRGPGNRPSPRPFWPS